MTPQRFYLLAEAYGADIGHWPLAERDAAHKLAARQLPEINAALQQAALLDSLLASHQQPAASNELAERIIASALLHHTQARKLVRPQWSWSGMLSGLGNFNLAKLGLAGTAVAGAGIAGALAGAFCVTIWTSGMLPESSADAQSLTADFVDLEQDWTAS